jgi:hypothetical protein
VIEMTVKNSTMITAPKKIELLDELEVLKVDVKKALENKR